MKVSAIIAAAGSARRFGGEQPKQFVALGGRPVLAWSIQAFSISTFITEIVVVSPSMDEEKTMEVAEKWAGRKPLKIVPGGATRQESVKAGLDAVSHGCEWVAVHDAARPLVSQNLIEAVCLMAQEVGAAIPGVSVRDTVKEVYDDGLVLRTLDRSNLYLAQTPQVCRKSDLLSAYELAEEKDIKATDEAGLLEALGVPVGVVSSSPHNFKITTQDDLLLAEALVKLASPS